MKNKSFRTTPVKAIQSIQYDLFTSFFGETTELSNNIELWDAIPKYAVSPRVQSAMRTIDNRLPVHECVFVYASRREGQRIESSCRVAIQPALIKTADGYVDFYPSTDEELVEEVIRKFFADQQYGVHDPQNSESWVYFSLQMIRKELQARGKTRSLDEIKRSIDILSKTHISLFLDDTDDPVYSAPILSDITRVTRRKYLDDTSMTWIARLPALVSQSINELTYRQLNYGILMSLSSQLARWLHKRLSRSYTNAGLLNAYDILFSSIQRDSGLLNCKRTHQNRQALEDALDELKRCKILNAWERLEERRQGRKIIDIKYSLHAHPEFIKDMKAANARLSESRLKLDATEPKPVDKLPQSGRQRLQ